MSVKFSNNGHSTLAASLTSSATSITVASGHGARFPSLSSGEYFYATLIDASNNLEIVKCTARSSDVLTVTRAQEGTTARAYAIGDRIELRVTAQGLVDATNIDNIVPSQSGNSGKFLKTDGTNVSFDTAGSTDASDLISGTLAHARLPAGCVLQVVTDHTYITSEVQISAGSSYNFPTISITPKSSSSSLIFFSNPRFYTRSSDRTSSNTYSNTHILIDDITNSTVTKHDEWINYSDAQASTGNTDGFRIRYPVLFTFANTVTTQRQFRTRAEAQSGSGAGRIGGEGYISQMIVEVE